MLKVAVIGVMTVMLAMMLRAVKSGWEWTIALAGSLLILMLSLHQMERIVSLIQKITLSLGEGAAYLQILIKMVGVAYIAEFGANICKDVGHQAVASQIEFYGKVMLLLISFPILENLLEVMTSFGG